MRAVRLFVIVALLTSVMSVAFCQEDRVRIAVMDFSPPGWATPYGPDYSGGKWASLGRTISELLTTHFVQSGQFDVVERSRLHQVLNEQHISSGQGILGEQARELGEELKAEAIVTGSFTRSRYGLELSIRLVSLKDASILISENQLVPSDPSAMEPHLRVLAHKLMNELGLGRGYVLDVFPDSRKPPLLMLDLGTKQGADEGRRVEIVTAGDAVIHPVTREHLGTRDVRLALATIVSAEDDLSYARVTERSGITQADVEIGEDGISSWGIERLQKARLLDEYYQRYDEDLSVLAARADVAVSTGIPESEVQIDGEKVALQDGEATVTLGAGTHLVEAIVGQSRISRTVMVSNAGAEPDEITFERSDLATASPIEEIDASGEIAAIFRRSEGDGSDPVEGRTWHVDIGCETPGEGTSTEQALTSIQAAIDNAEDGDEVVVYPGTYLENINFRGRLITVRSTDPTDVEVIKATVIDGQERDSVVVFASGETHEATIRGFTITNGKAALGGGIRCHPQSTETIESNLISGNFASLSGGGIYVGPSDDRIVIRSNLISSNTVRRADGFGPGGGIVVSACDGTISGNIVLENAADGHGGGICLGTDPVHGDYACAIRENVVVSNDGWIGGGISAATTNAPIERNLIAGNSAGHVGGGIVRWAGGNAVVRYNRIIGNSAGSMGGGNVHQHC